MTTTIPTSPDTSTGVDQTRHTVGVERITDDLRVTHPELMAEDVFAVVERFGPVFLQVHGGDSTLRAGHTIAATAATIARLREATFIEPCDYCGRSNCDDRDRHATWNAGNETVIRRRWAA